MQDWESALLARFASDEGWRLVEAFARQKRCLPDEVEKGAGIIATMLRDCGIEPVIHNPSIYLGIPISAMITGAGIRIEGKASALSPAVDGLTAPLLHLKARPSLQGHHPGDAASLFEQAFPSHVEACAAVSGKIVLTEGLSNPARTQLLQSWGASAVIVINPGDRSHWGTNSTIWGSPVGAQIADLPRIASVAVSRPEGGRLEAIAEAGGAVTLAVEALHGWFSQPVVTAEIRGQGPEAANFVLLHSHYDSWEYGVGDNATGNAVLLEVARAFAQNPSPFRRSVRFAWWPGHSAGRYAGSAWYADAFGPDLARNCVAHVNCDSPGCKDATSYASIRGMVEAAPLIQGTVRDLFLQDCDVTRPGRAGDYSFNNLGISGAMLTSSMVPKEERDRRGWYAVGGCGGSPAWHSEFDTIEVAQREILENDIRLYGLLTARLANEELIPLDYCRTLAELRAHLDSLAEGRLCIADATAINAGLISAEDQLKRATTVQTVTAQTLNNCLIRLSRSLVRLNYVNGASHQQDPAYAIAPFPSLAGITPSDSDRSRDDAILTLRARNSIKLTIDEIVRTMAALK